MPSVSIAQQRLMGQAWAIRKGELKKKDADPEAVKLADSDMKDKDMRAFASTKHKGLPDYVKEQLLNESGTPYINMKQYGESWMRQAWNYKDMMLVVYSTLEGMLKNLRERDPQYMKPKEIKDSEQMLEFLESLMEMIEKNK